MLKLIISGNQYKTRIKNKPKKYVKVKTDELKLKQINRYAERKKRKHWKIYIWIT